MVNIKTNLLQSLIEFHERADQFIVFMFTSPEHFFVNLVCNKLVFVFNSFGSYFFKTKLKVTQNRLHSLLNDI